MERKPSEKLIAQVNALQSLRSFIAVELFFCVFSASYFLRRSSTSVLFASAVDFGLSAKNSGRFSIWLNASVLRRFRVMVATSFSLFFSAISLAFATP
jgi:hypothetical protein